MTTLALQSLLWCVLIGAAALLVPVQQARARRVVALTGIWGLWIVPWLPAMPLGSSGAELGKIAAVVSGEKTAWMGFAAVVWLLGSLVVLMKIALEARKLAQWVREAELAPPFSFSGLEVRFSREVDGPCLAGFRSPCVLLPHAAAHWPAAELQAALRHEMQHARQHDGLHRLCAAVLRALFWWNPALHALCGIYEAESEVCCDLAATESEVTRRDYGEMLLAHATAAPARGLVLAFARRAGLRARITRLLSTRRDSGGICCARWLTALALLCGAGMLVAALRVPESDEDAALEMEARLRLEANAFPGS
jgi:beta-lactamase regulating signal transducer with metallopeptidase domain